MVPAFARKDGSGQRKLIDAEEDLYSIHRSPRRGVGGAQCSTTFATAISGHEPCIVSSGGRRLVRQPFRRADRRAGAGLAGHHGGPDVLIAAPTGSGKTLAAFLAAIEAWCARGSRAISGMRPKWSMSRPSRRCRTTSSATSRRRSPASAKRCATRDLPDVEIRTAVRTGDTTPGERDRMRRTPAAYRGHDAGVALHAARLRIRPRDA